MLGYNEYCNEDNSIMVTPKMRYYLPKVYSAVTGEVKVVDPEDVCKAMETYVLDENLRKQHGKTGKEKTNTYNWNKSMLSFVKRLKLLLEEDEDD